ncbi:MAG TPA: hypothetical protein VEC36_09275 [Patescibacteria group bacterium]|nr:hypothetical protein [Patescibacteria group bacterium]
MAFHSRPRFTEDFDIWINPSEDNAEKVLKCLHDFGFSNLDVSVEDFIKQDNVIQLGFPPFRIDLLTAIDGIDFETAFKNKVEIKDTQAVSLNFISFNDLLKNKQASARLKDKHDVECLNQYKK